MDFLGLGCVIKTMNFFLLHLVISLLFINICVLNFHSHLQNSISESEITVKQANSTTPMADSTTAVDSTNPETEVDANPEEKKDN